MLNIIFLQIFTTQQYCQPSDMQLLHGIYAAKRFWRICWVFTYSTSLGTLERGARGRQVPILPLPKRGIGGKSVLFMEQYISLTTLNLIVRKPCIKPLSGIIIAAWMVIPKYARESMIYISQNILDSILCKFEGCGHKIFTGGRPQIHLIFGSLPSSSVWSALAFPFDSLALPLLQRPCTSYKNNQQG